MNNTPDKAHLAYLLPGINALSIATQLTSLTPIREREFAAGSQIVRQIVLATAYSIAHNGYKVLAAPAANSPC